MTMQNLPASNVAGYPEIALSQLRLDPVNVRKTGRGPDRTFIASLSRPGGVITPFIVRPNGSGYLVTDGGKRLEALQALAEKGTIAADYPVPCIVADATDAEAR